MTTQCLVSELIPVCRQSGQNAQHWPDLTVHSVRVSARMLLNRSLHLARVNVFRRTGIDVGGRWLSVNIQVIRFFISQAFSNARVASGSSIAKRLTDRIIARTLT